MPRGNYNIFSEREIGEALPVSDNAAKTYLQCSVSDLLILEDSFCCSIFLIAGD